MGKDPALKSGYLIQNRLLLTLLFGIDWLLNRVVKTKTGPRVPPRRLLIANFAHLGDAVLTTSLLKPLKSSFPDIEIGVLISSGSRAVFTGHPWIQFVHTLDHPLLERGKRRLFSYFRRRRALIKELRACSYDSALDLRFHFPSSAYTLFAARIPERIGFRTAGMGALLTRKVAWRTRCTDSVSDYYMELADELSGFKRPSERPRPFLAPIKPEISEELRRRYSLQTKEYLVLHMGSGAPLKEWPLENWRALSLKLIAKGRRLVFTGKGAKEKEAVRQVTEGIEALDLVNALSFEELAALIQGAQALLSVDTSAGHIASSFATKTIALYTGIYPIALWSPLSEASLALTEPVKCAPCYNRRGCKSMSCVRDISVDRALLSLEELLR